MYNIFTAQHDAKRKMNGGECMKCQSCNAEIKEGSRFCIKCGAPVSGTAPEANGKNDAPAAGQAAAEPAPAVTAEPVKESAAEATDEPKAQKQKKAKKEKSAAEKTPRASQALNLLTPAQRQYVIPLLALLMINVLSYVLCSVALIATKTMLSPVMLYLLRFLGYAAAAGVLWIGSKKITGKNRIADAVFLLGLIAAERIIAPLFLNRLNALELTPNLIRVGAYLAAELLIAALMLIPLASLFSPKDKCKQGGKLSAFFFLLLSLFLPNILDFTITVINQDAPSFLQTFARKTAASFLTAGFISLAVGQLLKKQKSEKQNVEKQNVEKLETETQNVEAQNAEKPDAPKQESEKQAGGFGKIVKLAAGAVCLAGACAVPVVLDLARPVPVRIKEDITGYVLQGKIYLMQGNMTDSANAFQQAGEHCTAWNTVAGGSGYTVPEQYADDTILNYLAALRSGTDSLARRIVHSTTSEDLDLYGPIILEQFAASDQLDETMTAFRREILSVCAGREIFVNNYPSAEALQGKAKEIGQAIDPKSVDNSYSVQLTIAKTFGAAQSGEISPDTLVNNMLELAENQTHDIACQYAAAMVGSENVWDNAPHLDRTANAALRFLSLWESEGKPSVNAEQNLQVNRQICSMLLRIQHEDDAVQILEPLVRDNPEDGESMKLLLNCYLKAEDSENAFTLARSIHEAYPDDIDVLHDCCIGALQHHENAAAVQYADELAQLSVKDGRMDPDCDALLFNCVSYMSFNDSETWTRFQYAIYNGDEKTDPEIKAALEQSSFLNSYVKMMYYAMNKRDYEKALEIADSLIGQTDSSAKLWYMKGILHFNMREYEKSEEALRKSDEIQPNEGSTMYALANTCDALEKYEESYQLCKRVVALYPAGANHDEDWYGIVPHARSLMGSLKQYVKESD